MTPRHPKVLIQNVTVFDGERMRDGQTIVFENGLIVSDAEGAESIIDGNGAFLLPGLIDSHVHVHGADDLLRMACHGVTTCLDMGTRDLTVFEPLRGGVGQCDIRSAGFPAMPPGSRLTSRPGFPQKLIVHGPEDAKPFVTDRISDGADFIKVMIEPEGPDQPTTNAVAAAARALGRKSIAHATSCDTIERAVNAKVDVVTHAPLEDSLSNEVVSSMKASGTVAVPTMVKMLATATENTKLNYSYAKASVKRMHDAMVPIFSGTDANKNASGANISYGDSMWKELELLVEIGLSPLDALRSATALPASFFGLEDRGSIDVGKRADLILLSGNPLENISNINTLQRVWCSGLQVETGI